MSEETISEEQVLHNELSFEINQELIHLMKRIIEIQRANEQLKERIDKSIETLNDRGHSEYIEANMLYNLRRMNKATSILKGEDNE